MVALACSKVRNARQLNFDLMLLLTLSSSTFSPQSPYLLEGEQLNVILAAVLQAAVRMMISGFLFPFVKF